MKLNKILLTAVFLCLFSKAALAEDKKDAAAPATPENGFSVKTVAVVDVKRIIDESKAAKAAQKEVTALKDKYIKQIQDQDKKLKDRQKELVDQQKALSKEAFDKKVNEFKEKVITERKGVVQKQKILEAAFMKSLELIRDETIKVVGEIAKEKGIDMVIPTSQLLYNKQGIDISDEVLKKLNERLTKVDIKINQEALDKSDTDKDKAEK